MDAAELFSLQKLSKHGVGLVPEHMLSLGFAPPAMSVAGLKRRKRIAAEQTFSHHALPAANKLYHPIQVPAGRRAKLELKIVKELKHLSTEVIKEVGTSPQ